VCVCVCVCVILLYLKLIPPNYSRNTWTLGIDRIIQVYSSSVDNVAIKNISIT